MYIKPGMAPFLLVLKDGSIIKNIMATAGDFIIDLNTADVKVGIFYLLGIHYVFHIPYPTKYSQFLGFWQYFCLKRNDDFSRCSQYIKFAGLLKEKLEKL